MLAQGLFLAAATAAFCLFLRTILARNQPASWFNRQPSSARTRLPDNHAESLPQPHRGVRVRQVHPIQSEETDIDIIAVHGLDTNSPGTWEDRSKGKPTVNWLADEGMLPQEVSRARIFTCDWPADLFRDSNVQENTMDELARLLLEGILGRPRAANGQPNHQPILFIASCLGGIILMKALDMAYDKYRPIQEDTRGIVFLATPFHGTSFREVAGWAEPGLRAWASVRGQQATRLLDWVKSPIPCLTELRSRFAKLCRKEAYHVHVFYEKGHTDLSRKVPLLSFLPFLFSPPKQLVDFDSAALDYVPHPIPLDRNHVRMNKFRGPKDSDPDYKLVVDQIRYCLEKIRKGTPLERADAWIREKHYNKVRLQIERLSGDLLPMDQCYINLALVETQRADSSKQNPEERALRSSPFSLSDRLKIETQHENIQVNLEALFDPRKMPNGRTKSPRRLLIRGRAGVGKTTLCKKIVHDFTHGTMWRDKFDRLLWIPLRNLKREARTSVPGYNMGHLFRHEYFSGPEATDLTTALWGETPSEKTLFILDGLDEISSDLKDDMFQFLKELLNQPNIILTSRPPAVLPSGLRPLDIELETVGFYPQQVEDYVRACCTTTAANRIESFLQGRQLVQDLVRIPIQLDALCFTWDGFNAGLSLQTMTEFYRVIEDKLWKKDAVNLSKIHEGQKLKARPREIMGLVDDELRFLEALAFTGMHTDIIEFEPQHRDAVFDRLVETNIPLLDATVAALSFLRTSDSLSQPQDQQYHFLHLTFQEYFAARYFVRHWNTDRPLICLVFSQNSVKDVSPICFLQEHKYDSRYDIMWRFVAGLLDVEKKATRFFEEIEKEPFDLLGPTHQRLVMHCLSEAVSLPNEIRANREERLKEWILFESDFTGWSTFARDPELPDRVLQKALNASRNKRPILNALSYSGRLISETIMTALVELFKDEGVHVRHSAAIALGKQPTLSETTMTALVELLKDEDRYVRCSTAEALGNQSTLPETTMTALVELLKDEERFVRSSAAKALGNQSTLPETTMTAIVELFKHKDSDVRYYAAEALGNQSTLLEMTITTIVELFKDECSYVRASAADALGKFPEITMTALVGLLKDENSDVRRSAAITLGNQSTLSETTMTALVELFKDENSDVQECAAEALGKQSTLPEITMTALMGLLKHEDSDVRYYAAEALGNQSTLPETTMTALVELFKDENSDVQECAAEALGKQSTLPQITMTALVGLLEHEDSYIRRYAAEALDNQSTLLETTMTALVELFKDEDSYVRRSAAKALGNQSTLPETTMTAIVELFKHEDRHVRLNAAFALGNQSTLPETIVTALVGLFKHEDSHERDSAADALSDNSNLMDKVLEALGLAFRPESQPPIQASVFRYPQHMESLYQSFLRRSFKEQFSMYSFDKLCTIIQPSGLRTATLGSGDLFQFAVSNGRHGLRNISSYKLWEPFEEDSSQSSAASSLGIQSAL
ncbi:peptidaseCc14 [Colletotrichum tofieldiae]|uniref:PeptidaseCc14 n=1 Tax=Colletotrichum tofieldiae TaxID=708197 RepID=A0A161W8S7_9PEZI|nr:peptidaseCc14 [Colletotrichum tofieldiae]GKT92454.1 peptidaseCc14 [Colletotrichum tofieldiae]